MARITIRVQDPPALLAVFLDGEQLDVTDGTAKVHVSPGYHVLGVRAQDNPGVAFAVSIDEPPELEWTKVLVVGDDGRVAMQYGFHVESRRRGGGGPGSDWPGPRAIGEEARDKDDRARPPGTDDWPGPYA